MTETLNGLGTDLYEDYLLHALCIAGKSVVLFNGKEMDFNEGDLMIVRKGKLIENFTHSDDFKVRVIYVRSPFIELCTPKINYGTKGQLSLFFNPIMHLSPDQFDVCKRDFDVLDSKLNSIEHHFYDDIMASVVQMIILDFYDFHSHIYGDDEISGQNAEIMSRFIEMLENGEYRLHREVTYYADKLCITSKYLSEVSKKVSGYPANYWINRYAVLDISRLLKDKSVSLLQVSEMFGFLSPSYFSRYVKNYLGVSPKDYR